MRGVFITIILVDSSYSVENAKYVSFLRPRRFNYLYLFKSILYFLEAKLK